MCSEVKEPMYNETHTISMTTFILATVGVSVTVAVICSAFAFTVGMLAGIRRNRSTKVISQETQVSALPTSSNPENASREAEVEYEEINNLELKDILINGNVAYGTKP